MTEVIQGQFRDPFLDVTGEVVGFYPREFFPFDNFSSFQVEWRERRFATSEHAYHFEKFVKTAPEVAEAVFDARSAHEALKMATVYRERRRPDWDEVKVGIMEQIVRAKLSQHYYIQQKLLQTGMVPIVEDSTKDYFWGWGPDRDGRNELGRIWMRLREELRLGKIALLPESDYTL